MNWLDITLLCLAGIGLVKGLFDGFIKQVVSLIALLVAIFFCGKVAIGLRSHIVALELFSAEGSVIASYIAAFLLIVGVLVLVGEVLNRVIDVTPLGLLNHLAGGIFGMLVMLLMLSLSLNLFELMDKGSVLISHETKVESHFYYPIKELIATIYPSGMFIFKG